MPLTSDHWRLNAISHTDRLTGVAMHKLDDTNEARWLVHRVLIRAMDNMLGPISGLTLDAALAGAVRTHRANAA